MSVSGQEIHAAARAAHAKSDGGKTPWAELTPECRTAWVEEIRPAAAILRPEGMTLVGRCRDCAAYKGLRCLALRSPMVARYTDSDFGCVHFSPVTPRNR